MTPGDDGAGDVEQGELVGRLLGPADAEIAGGLRLHCGYLDVRAVLADVGLASQLERHTQFCVEDGFDPCLS